jgi:hypothetical protein
MEGIWTVLTSNLFDELVTAMNQSNTLLIDTMLLKVNGSDNRPGPD